MKAQFSTRSWMHFVQEMVNEVLFSLVRPSALGTSVLCASLLCASLLCASLLFCATPAFATKLPQEFKDYLGQQFPAVRIRLDGALETKDGRLFLPLLPANAPKVERTQIHATFPDEKNPDCIFYTNGWCYVRVLNKTINKANMRTVVLPANMPENTRKHFLTLRFPSDLIVPERLVMPKSLKPILGDLAIGTVEDPVVIQTQDTGESVATTEAGPKHGAVFVTSPGSGKITLLEENTLKKIAEFPTEGTPCGMTCVDGTLYIADQSKNRILKIDPKKREFVGQIDLSPKCAPKGLVALPNGRLLYVSESAANDIAVIETATGKVLLKTRVPAGPARMTITPNGNTLIMLNVPANQVTFMSTLNQKVLGWITVGAMPNALTVSKDGRFVYVSSRLDNIVSVIDIVRRQILAKIETGAGPTGVALSHDGTKLFVAQAKDNTIGAYDLTTNKKISDVKLPLDVDFPSTVMMMPDSDKLIVSSHATDAVGIFNTTKLEFENQPVIGHNSDELIWVPL